MKMDRSIKFLLTLIVFIIFSGFGLIWSGIGFKDIQTAQSTPIPTIQAVEKESTSSAFLGVDGEKALVIKVVDGDTFEIESGKKVRMVGINTPETVDPRRPVGCFGKEASNRTKELLANKEVILQKDVSETDKYGRLLRLVYLPLEDGQLLFVNDYLVREGYAKLSTFPPDVKFAKQFQQAEREAREKNRGLWGRC